MTTVYRQGEAGTLGFPVIDPETGAPWDATGLDARMVIYLDGVDLVLPGYWLTDQQVIDDGVAMPAATVMAFDIASDSILLPPRVYRAALQIEGRNGWRTLPDGEINIEVRSL
ncbi:hypothetical protein PAF17_10575 [Paracoccus sp. Z330]|uniref:Uncharacterized protein n=1 Tax=Paracoccus onchidii TaxID=3017813 RepID=A0ABT4ZGX1_9RHOB|nr:hypothetical protein [Paracoccus onchidii]MDB6177945.1 hypothetical protein [Paracoccus onchidii]